VIPSLAGEGMGIAMASGMRAAQAWMKEGPGGSISFQHALARSTARPVGIAGWIARVAGTVPGRRLAPLMAPFAGSLARLTRIQP
jgi:menaquinone-9 beta-reductase